MKTLLLVLALGTSLYSAGFDCDEQYQQATELAQSSIYSDVEKAATIIIELDKHQCSVIGTDGEYELELKIASVLENFKNQGL